MNVIKITKRTKTKLEHTKLIVAIYCLLSGIKISDTESTIYSYFIIYKINDSTKKLIFDSELIHNNNSYKNILSKLKKLGLIQKNERREYFVGIDVLKSIESTVGFILKIDNT